MELLSLVDLVISQGGVNTINEILSMQVPAILIPARRRVDSQEKRIAKMLKVGNYACLKEMSAEVLSQEVASFYQKNNIIKKKNNNIKNDDKLIEFLLEKI